VPRRLGPRSGRRRGLIQGAVHVSTTPHRMSAGTGVQARPDAAAPPSHAPARCMYLCVARRPWPPIRRHPTPPQCTPQLRFCRKDDAGAVQHRVCVLPWRVCPLRRDPLQPGAAARDLGRDHELAARPRALLQPAADDAGRGAGRLAAGGDGVNLRVGCNGVGVGVGVGRGWWPEHKGAWGMHVSGGAAADPLQHRHWVQWVWSSSGWEGWAAWRTWGERAALTAMQPRAAWPRKMMTFDLRRVGDQPDLPVRGQMVSKTKAGQSAAA
jgi:hypothetical protein